MDVLTCEHVHKKAVLLAAKRAFQPNYYLSDFPFGCFSADSPWRADAGGTDEAQNDESPAWRPGSREFGGRKVPGVVANTNLP